MLTNNFNFELLARVKSGPNSINDVYQLLGEKNYKKVGLVPDAEPLGSSTLVFPL